MLAAGGEESEQAKLQTMRLCSIWLGGKETRTLQAAGMVAAKVKKWEKTHGVL